MDYIAQLLAQNSHPQQRIVLAEGDDARVQQAAARAQHEGVAQVVVLGARDRVRAGLCAWPGGDYVEIVDPIDTAHSEQLVQAYYQLRRSKGLSLEQARAQLLQPVVHATMMLRLGLVSGSVAGASHSTAEVVRAALQIVGPERPGGLVSSCFLMLLDPERHSGRQACLFTDCALVPEPDSEQLAGIALAGIRSCSALLQTQARVAMLSFSTHGSAQHRLVEKVRAAAERVRSLDSEALVSLDLQFDSAFSPRVSVQKAPDGALSGDANVFVFPSLEAGNIGYKIAQYLGGVQAVGPILQGLRAPANDLSRGCSADDIYQMIAITALQAARSQPQL